MPSYTFKNKKTGESWNELVSISTMEQMLQDNPDYEIDITGSFPAMVGSERLGMVKPDETFRDMLREMGKVHNKRGGKINTFD